MHVRIHYNIYFMLDIMLQVVYFIAIVSNDSHYGTLNDNIFTNGTCYKYI